MIELGCCWSTPPDQREESRVRDWNILAALQLSKRHPRSKRRISSPRLKLNLVKRFAVGIILDQREESRVRDWNVNTALASSSSTTDQREESRVRDWNRRASWPLRRKRANDQREESRVRDWNRQARPRLLSRRLAIKEKNLESEIETYVRRIYAGVTSRDQREESRVRDWNEIGVGTLRVAIPTIKEKNLESEIETQPSQASFDVVIPPIKEKNLESEIETTMTKWRQSMWLSDQREESRVRDWNSRWLGALFTERSRSKRRISSPRLKPSFRIRTNAPLPSIKEKNLESEIETQLSHTNQRTITVDQREESRVRDWNIVSVPWELVAAITIKEKNLESEIETCHVGCASG